MELSRLGHACVRLEKPGSRLVIDPGAFSAPDAVDGADAVLVTHQHADHVALPALRQALADAPALEVWAPAAVVAALTDGAPQVATRVHAVSAGDAFDAAGFAVRVFGGLHAVVHADIPRIANLAYLVDGAVLHPGDSFTLPATPVDVLLAPTGAPWLKAAEVIDYVRAVGPRLVLPIHDAFYSAAGLALVDTLLGPNGPGIGGAEYRRPTEGEKVAVR
jgi:L-ascorbate metabolism protein UlaG (beta-lactamase superfamily)